MDKTIAIIGAGPAGSMLAYKLASDDKKVLLYDHKASWEKPCCGNNWMLIGSAAGHVNPAVGEGIYYAPGSAKVAAQAILQGDIHSYDTLWKNRYGDTLKQGASFRQTMSSLAQSFGPEIIGAMMYARGMGSSSEAGE
jgi:flavin-dependent dehydrogenase